MSTFESQLPPTNPTNEPSTPSKLFNKSWLRPARTSLPPHRDDYPQTASTWGNSTWPHPRLFVRWKAVAKEWQKEQLQIAQAQDEMTRRNLQSLKGQAARRRGSTSAEQQQEKTAVRFSSLPDSVKLMELAAWTATSSSTTACAPDSPLDLAPTSPSTAPLSWPLLIEQTRSHAASAKPIPKTVKTPLKYHQKAPYWREATQEDTTPEERRRHKDERLARYTAEGRLTRGQIKRKNEESRRSSGRTYPPDSSPS